jgi:hypothetical protein
MRRVDKVAKRINVKANPNDRSTILVTVPAEVTVKGIHRNNDGKTYIVLAPDGWEDEVLTL